VDFSAFGTVLDESSPSSGDRMMGFAGMERDTATGLNLAVFREENPGTGRWDSQDPLGLGGGDSNPSRYVGNEPVSQEDTLGAYHIVPLGSWTADDLVEVYRQLQIYKIRTRRNIQQVIAFRDSLTTVQRARIEKELKDLLKILNRIAKKLDSEDPLGVCHGPGSPSANSGEHRRLILNEIWLNDNADWKTQLWVFFHELSHDSGAIDGYITLPFFGPILSAPLVWDAAQLQALGTFDFDNTILQTELKKKAQNEK
jgi:RHS repeat-associated protein